MKQEGLEVFSPEQLAEIDEEIKQLKDEKQQILDHFKKLQSEREQASRALSNEELDERIATLQTQVAKQEAELKRLSSVQLATPEEKKCAEKNLEVFVKE